jgi:hypothetical protein
MSIPVELSDLAATMARYRFAYLLTGTDQGAPHAIAVTPTLDGSTLVVQGVGRRTGKNLQARAEVALVWPPLETAGYSLIVDGSASVAGAQVRIVPTRAVLHRPAPASEPQPQGSCTSDCVELKL